ncbi:ATP-binding cassette domain-containing protein [Natrialbaceae archaeon A-chndr2]
MSDESATAKQHADESAPATHHQDGEATTSQPQNGEAATPQPQNDEATSESRAQKDSSGEGTEPILTAESLTQRYGAVPVFEDLEVEIEPASVTALIGPNGSGKTTLLRALAKLYRPTSGRVQYHGPSVPRPIGYLPQQPRFRPGFSVRETLSFYARLVSGDREHATETATDALERVGLEAAADRPVEALSGGMTRLLGIAQATIGDPPVVVFDEPASGLDPGMGLRVFDVATDLADAGTAVIVSSHDLELVETHADTVFMLDSGDFVAHGPPNSLYAAHEADSLLEVYRAAISGDADRVRVRGDGE